MRISQLTDARVGVLGFGVEGRATVAALRRSGHRGVVAILVDRPDATAALPENVELALNPDVAIERLDILIRSPGFAPHHALRQLADARGVTQTTAMNLFFAELRAHGISSIGVTGSKGKSTTSTLIHRSLAESGVPTALVGNIGAPALDALEGVLARRAVPVVELSSYHCADLVAAPSIAVLLQLFPEHMDWHGGVADYYGAKMRIALQQAPGDRFFYLAANHAFVAGFELPGQAIPVGVPEGFHFRDGWFWRGSERLFSDDCVRIPGQHNRENIAAVVAAATAAGAESAGIQAALAGFDGLPFRLQDEGSHGGIRWVNDSISTAPEATAAALHAFRTEARTLIVGGFDRGYDVDVVARALAETRVERVIALPVTGHRLAEKLAASGSTILAVPVEDLAAAVRAAAEATPSGGLCLFSPGAPSYGFFRDFEDRGRQFSVLIRRLEP